MDIEKFNQMPATDAVALLRACAAIDSWAEGLAHGRPYADTGALLEAARQRAAAWTDEEVEEALADHPRIGERPEGDGPSNLMASSEQAGVDPADTELQQRLADGNRRYEERFGRIYLVRARGRTGRELLEILEQRLSNDPETEREVTRQQLAEIAVLRLEGQLA